MRAFVFGVVGALLLSACGGGGGKTPTAPAPAVNHAPTIASVSVSPAFGIKHLTLFTLTVQASDPDGDPLAYTWEVAPGEPPKPGQTVQTAYGGTGGQANARVTVSDDHGNSTQAVTAVFMVGAMDGTWRSIQTPLAGWSFQLVLTQNGANVAGSFSDNRLGSANTEPLQPGRIDAGGNVEITFRPPGYDPFTLRGVLDASGRRLSGGVYGSGFNGQAFVVEK